MKTAVEWLIEQTRKPEWHSLKRGDILEQAKEMEKDATKKAYEVGLSRGMLYDEDIYHKNNWRSSEQYYTETFKSETLVTEFRDGTVNVETFKKD